MEKSAVNLRLEEDFLDLCVRKDPDITVAQYMKLRLLLVKGTNFTQIVNNLGYYLTKIKSSQ